jgi:hypothetical protein
MLPRAVAGLGPLVLFAAVAGATLAAAVSGGNPALALLPAALVGLAYAAASAPLRLSAAALLALLLAAEDHGDIALQWRSPLAVVGDLLHFRVDAVAGIPGVAVTGTEVALALLFAVWVRRRARGDRTDAPDVVEPASILRSVLVLYVGAVVLSEVVGLARGLPLAPWKLRNLLHPLALALLFLAAFRAERDQLLAGRVVVFAALCRAVQAVVVQQVAAAETGGPLAHATSHGDSVLFSVAMVLLVVDLAERPDGRRLLRAAVLLPVLLMGAVENNRRILWVMVGLMLIAWYAVGRRQAWGRAVTRVLVFSLPVVALYVGVGWDRGSRVFAPVKILRGVTDTSRDRSAYWREVENWNIAMSMRQSPLLGVGLGGEYTEVMANDDVSAGFKEYREWPHNTVLGLLLLMGVFGATAVLLLPALVVFLSVRSYRLAATASQRVAAAGTLAAVVACQVLAWGDTGAHFPQYKVVLALAVAVSARLASATGAWPARPRQLRPTFA